MKELRRPPRNKINASDCVLDLNEKQGMYVGFVVFVC